MTAKMILQISLWATLLAIMPGPRVCWNWSSQNCASVSSREGRVLVGAMGSGSGVRLPCGGGHVGGVFKRWYVCVIRELEFVMSKNDVVDGGKNEAE